MKFSAKKLCLFVCVILAVMGVMASSASAATASSVHYIVDQNQAAPVAGCDKSITFGYEVVRDKYGSPHLVAYEAGNVGVASLTLSRVSTTPAKRFVDAVVTIPSASAYYIAYLSEADNVGGGQQQLNSSDPSQRINSLEVAANLLPGSDTHYIVSGEACYLHK